jgi:hypothetical protein
MTTVHEEEPAAEHTTVHEEPAAEHSLSTATAPAPTSTLHHQVMHVPQAHSYPMAMSLPPAEAAQASAEEVAALGAAQHVPTYTSHASGNMALPSISAEGIEPAPTTVGLRMIRPQRLLPPNLDNVNRALALHAARKLVSAAKDTLSDMMTASFGHPEGSPERAAALKTIDLHVQAVAKARALIEESEKSK